MAEPERPHLISLSDEELQLLLGAMQSEASFPDTRNLNTEQREEALRHWKEACELHKRLPSPFTDEDIARLSEMALRELEELDRPRRATSWRHSIVRDYVKAL